MQTIKKRIAERILAGVRKVNPDTALTADEIAGMLEYPPDPAMGDLASDSAASCAALRVRSQLR